MFFFFRIDNEIQDTLMKRSISSEDEQVVRASQRTEKTPSEISPKDIEDSVLAVEQIYSSFATHHQNVETHSTSDSLHEIHFSYDGMSPFENATDAVWCVTMPSEAVLHCDRLVESFENYGKVLNVQDLNE